MRGDIVNRRTGVCKTAVKQGRPQTPRNQEEIDRINKEKEICLNCPRAICYGDKCRRFKRELFKLQYGE